MLFFSFVEGMSNDISQIPLREFWQMNDCGANFKYYSYHQKNSSISKNCQTVKENITLLFFSYYSITPIWDLKQAFGCYTCH